MNNNDINTAIDSIIALANILPVNDATIDALATCLIPVCDNGEFTIDHALRLLTATDHIPPLVLELADTIGDNTELDLSVL